MNEQSMASTCWHMHRLICKSCNSTGYMWNSCFVDNSRQYHSLQLLAATENAARLQQVLLLQLACMPVETPLSHTALHSWCDGQVGMYTACPRNRLVLGSKRKAFLSLPCPQDASMALALSAHIPRVQLSVFIVSACWRSELG